MHFDTRIFRNSKIGKVTRYGDAGPGPKGSVMSTALQLDGEGCVSAPPKRSAALGVRYCIDHALPRDAVDQVDVRASKAQGARGPNRFDSRLRRVAPRRHQQQVGAQGVGTAPDFCVGTPIELS